MALFERLRAAGHRIAVQQVATAGKRSAQLKLIERLEAGRAPRSLMRLATPPAEVAGQGNHDLTIDLTGCRAHGHAPVLSLDFDGQRELAAVLPLCWRVACAPL